MVASTGGHYPEMEIRAISQGIAALMFDHAAGAGECRRRTAGRSDRSLTTRSARSQRLRHCRRKRETLRVQHLATVRGTVRHAARSAYTHGAPGDLMRRLAARPDRRDLCWPWRSSLVLRADTSDEIFCSNASTPRERRSRYRHGLRRLHRAGRAAGEHRSENPRIVHR
jgi:hypothetical protein